MLGKAGHARRRSPPRAVLAPTPGARPVAGGRRGEAAAGLPVAALGRPSPWRCDRDLRSSRDRCREAAAHTIEPARDCRRRTKPHADGWPTLSSRGAGSGATPWSRLVRSGRTGSSFCQTCAGLSPNSDVSSRRCSRARRMRQKDKDTATGFRENRGLAHTMNPDDGAVPAPVQVWNSEGKAEIPGGVLVRQFFGDPSRGRTHPCQPVGSAQTHGPRARSLQADASSSPP
jgi:hypothetical protein